MFKKTADLVTGGTPKTKILIQRIDTVIYPRLHNLWMTPNCCGYLDQQMRRDFPPAETSEDKIEGKKGRQVPESPTSENI